MISYILPTSMRTTAGYSMLVDGLNEKIVSDREVIATTLISSFPSTLSHLFNYFIPLVIPVLAFAAFLKTCFGIGKRSRTDQCNRDCKHLCRDNPCGQPPH